MMTMLETMKTLGHLAAFKMTETRCDLSYCPSGLDPATFISASEAAQLIPDGATVITAGMAGHARCSIFFWAVKDAYLKKKSPSGLTWITVSAQGGRGRGPGTIEELAIPGLLSEYITGHVDTARAQLLLGETGHLEIHTLPQGEITELLNAQAIGMSTIVSDTGIGTFLDPELGGGTAVTRDTLKSYVKRNGKHLEYTLPLINVALFNAPYADREGNIYFKHAAAITEIMEASMAAHHNGGKVIATVSGIIDKNESGISLPAQYVDHIVINPWNEQTVTVKQKKYWPMFTVGANVNIDASLKKLKILNRIVKASPMRGPTENALSRMAASLLVNVAEKGNLINLGIGLPEEVGRMIYEGGLFPDFTFTSETGVYGGLPAPGLFFGGAINPQKIESSPWIFNHYKTHLDVAVLGFLQVDSTGNVNASRRGPKVTDYVGPGGFMNIADSANTIIFIGSWMAKADFRLEGGKLRLKKKGIPKFVALMNETTFNAREALKKGKRIFYVTTIGIFQLTGNGPKLIQVMPGIDIERDVLKGCTARIRIDAKIKTVQDSIVTGENYRLSWDATM